MLLELAQKHGLLPKKSAATHGGEYTCACPACGGNDRFHIWPMQNDGEGSYWCRGCDKGGDAIQFLVDFSGMDFKSAAAYLGKKLPEGSTRPFKRPTQASRPAAAPELKTPQAPEALWSEKARKFVDWAHDYLLSSKKHLGWLAQERGLTRASIEKYRLGWNRGDDKGKDLYRPREAWGLPTELKDGRKKRLWLPVGLVIPLIVDDAVIRIRIRRFEGEPRYYILPGSSTAMFFQQGINYLVVESELDFILVKQEAPDLVGLLALGSSASKPDPEIDRRLTAAGIILNALDYDEAGAKAAAWWEARYPQTKRWPVPVGKDPTDSWKAGVSLRDWITLAFPKGWSDGLMRIGQKSLGAAVSNAVPAPELPASVLRLYALLAVHPVAVQNTAERLRLLEPAGWARKNWEISHEISNLVFFDADVLGYLSGHPAKQISGKNFLRD